MRHTRLAAESALAVPLVSVPDITDTPLSAPRGDDSPDAMGPIEYSYFKDEVELVRWARGRSGNENRGAPGLSRARAGTAARASSRRNRLRAPVLERGDERLGADGQRSRFVMDHVKVPLNVQASEADQGEPAGLEFAPHGIDGHKGHAEACHHGLLDRLRVTEHQHPADLDVGLLERALGHLPGRRPVLTHQQALPGQ